MLTEEEVQRILDVSLKNIVVNPVFVAELAQEWFEMKTFMKNELEELKLKAKFESECG